MTGQGNRIAITTKDMEAIERIKGYCCEVTQEQWEELVKVADGAGCDVGPVSRRCRPNEVDKYAQIDLHFASPCLCFYDDFPECQIIPFPDFLAKLKGEEKWEPKAGEMVEVSVGSPSKWVEAEFVCIHKGYYICSETNIWNYLPFSLKQMRPLRPTITRAEAESFLNKRIID
jgi:hypothetical protein